MDCPLAAGLPLAELRWVEARKLGRTDPERRGANSGTRSARATVELVAAGRAGSGASPSALCRDPGHSAPSHLPVGGFARRDASRARSRSQRGGGCREGKRWNGYSTCSSGTRGGLAAGLAARDAALVQLARERSGRTAGRKSGCRPCGGRQLAKLVCSLYVIKDLSRF